MPELGLMDADDGFDITDTPEKRALRARLNELREAHRALEGLADMGASGKVLPLFVAMIIGDAVCLVLGFLWLLAMAGSVTWIDQSNLLGSAFSKAVQPFLIWDLLKMAFAALTISGIWTLLRRKS